VTRPSSHRPAASYPVAYSCPHGRQKDTCFTCTPSSRPTCPICKGLGIAKFRHTPDSKFCREQRALKPAPQTGLPPAQHGTSPAANYASSSLSFNVDSGATNHVVCNKDAVEIYSLNSLPISIADGRLIPTTGLASFSSQLPLSDILVAPTFTQNLLSTYQLAKTGLVTAFDEHNVYIGKGLRLDELIAQGTQRNGSYHLTLESATTSTNSAFNPCVLAQPPAAYQTTLDIGIDDWHLRLNHLHEKALQELAKAGILSFSPSSQLKHCEGCEIGKAKSGSAPARSDTEVKQPGDLTVADLTGPITPVSTTGHLYILSIVDVYARYVTVYLLKTKSESTYYLIKYANQFRTKFNRNIKILRTDNGTEFINRELNQYCHENGIVQQQTIRHSSHQNGIAERMFYTLLDSVRAMLHSSGLSRQHRDSAVRYAAYTRNLSPTSSCRQIQGSPLCMWLFSNSWRRFS
jgi:hypothetical protein